MQQIIVDISISPDEWIKLYQGVATDVHTRARRTFCPVPGPYSLPFFLNDGVRGSFRILFDDAGKFTSIERL